MNWASYFWVGPKFVSKKMECVKEIEAFIKGGAPGEILCTCTISFLYLNLGFQELRSLKIATRTSRGSTVGKTMKCGWRNAQLHFKTKGMKKSKT